MFLQSHIAHPHRWYVKCVGNTRESDVLQRDASTVANASSIRNETDTTRTSNIKRWGSTVEGEHTQRPLFPMNTVQRKYSTVRVYHFKLTSFLAVNSLEFFPNFDHDEQISNCATLTSLPGIITK